ncbi:MAG: methyl-accepting chemotaxis protein [Desulfosudaceae bacterium]
MASPRPPMNSTEIMPPVLEDQRIATGPTPQDTPEPEHRPQPAEHLRESLPPKAESLKKFIDEAEADFMLVGIGLRTVHANVKELTDLMLNTVQQMGTDEDAGFLKRGRVILESSLEEIESYQEGVRGDLDRINTVMGKLEELYATSKQIKKFSKSLQTVALTMLVENARSIDSSVSIFSDVAREVKELSVNISGIANDVYQNVENARKVHYDTYNQITAGIGHLETLTAEIQSTVRDSTRDTETLMQFSVDTIEQAGRRSRDISRLVAEIVVGVQFHDNLKQRIMHIAAVLEAMAATARPAGRLSKGEQPDSATAAEGLLADQAGRLDEMTGEVEAVYRKNRMALENIQQEVSDLLRGLRKMAGDDNENQGGAMVHDPFSHLKVALTQLHHLMDRGQTLYGRIQEAAEHVTGIAANLTELLEVVRGISAHTHNKAINSIIAADREGARGGALKLLAQEMNELASRSDALSGEVETIISSIIDLAENIGTRRLYQADQKQDNALQLLDQVLEEISTGYESFRQNSLTAYERARELKKSIDTTLHSLDFFQGLSSGLRDHSRELVDLGSAIDLSAISVAVDTIAVGHLPGSYTEPQEDNVILFDNAGKQKQAAHRDTAQADDENLGDNVELF